MPFNDPGNDSLWQKLASAGAGAIVSTRFLAGTWPEKIIMAIGGAALSFFASPAITEWLEVSRAEGLVGFMTGLFGMAIVSKVYEVIQLMDAKAMSDAAWQWIKRKWGA